MTYVETFLTELEREAGSTRRVLERVPEGRNTWKPHPRSMELGYLAALLASMPGWIAMMVNDGEIDYNPPVGPPPRAQVVETTAELLRMLDDSVVAAREALMKTTDEHLRTSWRILLGGKVVDEKPRHSTLR